MKLSEIFEESIIVLKTNRMRTALSALGIIIGIGSVIALMTLGVASQKSVTERIQSLGSNLLVVSPGSQQQGFLRGGGGNTVTTLKLSDAEALINDKRITTVTSVAGEYSSNAQISYEDQNTNTSIAGVSADYFTIKKVELEYGEVFGQSDDTLSTKVAVIGYSTAEELFTTVSGNLIGESFRIKGISFKIIGITKESSSSSNGVYIPLSTAQKSLFGTNYLTSIYVSAASEDLMDAAENQIGFLLLERHGISLPEDADFSISSQEDLLETMSEVTKTFTSMLTGIAAISLVVGGIGIMNIMLVTVTERTREIGIRKALGAKRKAIVTQFLVESIILTFIGGIIGVFIGVGGSLILTKVMSMPTTISVSSIFLAVAVSCLIGIVFGWYPAQKASKLQPIEALRYE